MVLRVALFVNLLMLGLPLEATLESQVSARACKSTVTGTLEVIPLESKVYANERSLRVWLPPGYSDSATASKRYPVLYLFDGQQMFDRCTSQPFPDEWHVDEILTDLIAKKTVEPLIVVGIDNAGAGHREDEFSRYSAVADAPQKLSAFMTTEVLPLIDGHYRTISDRAHRGVGGASLGSLAALTLLLDQPDTFGLGLLESTSLQNGNGRVLQETASVVQGPIRVSIGVGTAEVPPAEAAAHGFPYFDEAFLAMNQRLAENLKKSLMNRPEVKLTVQPGGQHQPRYWSERFGPAVSFLFPPEPDIKSKGLCRTERRGFPHCPTHRLTANSDKTYKLASVGPGQSSFLQIAVCQPPTQIQWQHPATNSGRSRYSTRTNQDFGARVAVRHRTLTFR